MQSTAFCIKLDRNETVNTIQNMRKARRKNIPHIRIIRMHNKLLLYHVRGRIVEFLTRHNHALSDVPFQADANCEFPKG